MEVKEAAVSGTLESSDILVRVEKGTGGVEIELDSTVEDQFGDEIRELIQEIITKMGIQDIRVVARDQGALNCTIRARLITAIHRSCRNTDYRWGESL